MKKIFLLLFFAVSYKAFSQTNPVIDVREVERVERILSSDEMQGRKVFTPGIDKAADFIASEFKAAGLKTWNNNGAYRQEFMMVRPRFVSIKGEINDEEVDPKNIIAITSKKELEVKEKSGYEIAYIKAGQNLFKQAAAFVQSNKNMVVFVDTSFSKNFSKLTGLKRQLFKSNNSVVFFLTSDNVKEFKVKANHEINEQKLSNVLGVLAGKGKANEYVVFSAHYDHLGIGRPVENDSIYNGANDDAAGTTAVIMLAKYFEQLKNNERTLIFVAFTAEETGGYGSQFFSKQLDPKQVIAMFNIEMIGTESKWGKNSAYITGYDKTDMGKIMQENLKGTEFAFHPDPYPEQDLFYRSDNATLARLGVAAHTISTSKMDNEPNYHKPSDEIETLDMENMAAIIRAIAKSSVSIINGKTTPTRVKVEDLR
ncbi:MAG: M28 family peptidase [Chitinophagaceae bacterium]